MRRTLLVASLMALDLASSSFDMLAAHPPATYEQMAPLAEYLMPDRNREIALARSAAPDSISRDARILVLGKRGYEVAVEGRNGFVCLVERSWAAPSGNAEFWNPRLRGPVCLNPQAARAVLPFTLRKTEMVLAGRSRREIIDWMKSPSARRELPPMEAGAMSFMMSKDAYLTDQGSHVLSHLMFYTPVIDVAEWGADARLSPVMAVQQGPPEPFDIFIVPVGKWSDGTPAPMPH